MTALLKNIAQRLEHLFNRLFRNPERAILRLAIDDDLPRIKAFLEMARMDPGRTETLGIRDDAEYQRAIECYIVEVEGNIIALACVFSFPPGGPLALELGSLCVAPKDYEGFRLQEMFMALGVATAITQATAISQKEDAQIYAGAKRGSKSEKGIVLTGFRESSRPELNTRKYCHPCDQKPEDYPAKCCVAYYDLPHDHTCRNVRLYLKTPRVQTRTRKEDGRRLILDRVIHLDSIRSHRRALAAWVKERCPDV